MNMHKLGGVHPERFQSALSNIRTNLLDKHLKSMTLRDCNYSRRQQPNVFKLDSCGMESDIASYLISPQEPDLRSRVYVSDYKNFSTALESATIKYDKTINGSNKDTDTFENLLRSPLSIDRKASDACKSFDDEGTLVNNMFSLSDENGDTVLHLAVLHNLPNLVDIICNLGLWVQVNARNSLFQTPLHLAVLTSNLRSALTLLSAKSSVDVQDYRGNTPLHLACLHGDIDLVVAMIEGNLCAEYIVINCSSDYKIGKISKLHKEILHSLNAKCLQRSYPKTFDVSASENVRAFRDNPALHIRNYDGLMCLHLAVIYACADLVSLLLSKGADVNAKDAKSGRTALHLAVDCCQPSTAVVTLLLSSPCVILDNTNFANQTPLQLAKGRGHFSLVLLLKAHGARTTEGAYDHDTTGAISEDEQDDDCVCLPCNRPRY